MTDPRDDIFNNPSLKLMFTNTQFNTYQQPNTLSTILTLPCFPVYLTDFQIYKTHMSIHSQSTNIS